MIFLTHFRILYSVKGGILLDSYFEFHIADREGAYAPWVHYHPDYEVYYLTEGSCRYFIHDKTYRLTPGDIVVIPPGCIHKVIYESETHSRMLFNCTVDFLPSSVLNIFPSLAYCSQSTDTAKQIEAIYRRIRQSCEQPDEFQKDTLRCCAMELFLTLAKNHRTEEIPVSSTFVEKAVAYIRANYMYRLTLTETAAHCAVSPEHLSRVFKKETGFGFSEYLNLYRLKKAESILKSGKSQSIAQIASLCGFSDSNYFSGAYKKMFGISPSQVKKQVQQEAGYV